MSAPPHETDYEHFIVTQPYAFVTHVQINRPTKLNSFIETMWLDLERIFEQLSSASDVRAVVLSGVGDRAFTTGLDVQAATQGKILGQGNDANYDVARRAVMLRRHVAAFQKCISSVERCEKPVICVINGFTYGLGIDISACADIRLCSQDARFAVKEVDIGIAADIGTLTRLPKVVGSFSWVKDVSLSARPFGAEEAYRVGYVSQVLETKTLALETALRMAVHLAIKSPIAVQGTKELLNHARDHSVEDSLRYTGVWNSAALQTEDVSRALSSNLKKKTPKFEKL